MKSRSSTTRSGRRGAALGGLQQDGAVSEEGHRSRGRAPAGCRRRSFPPARRVALISNSSSRPASQLTLVVPVTTEKVFASRRVRAGEPRQTGRPARGPARGGRAKQRARRRARARRFRSGRSGSRTRPPFVLPASPYRRRTGGRPCPAARRRSDPRASPAPIPPPASASPSSVFTCSATSWHSSTE